MSELNSLKNDGQNLSQLFKKGWKDFLEIEDSSEPSNSDSYQKKTKLCIETFIKCTHMVNILGLFSSNEHIDEISTETISFLLLPAFLGELSLKLISDERKSSVKNALVYFRSFLKHCQDYQITNKKLSHYIEDESEEEKKPDTDTIRNKIREEKISRFKENKLLENSIKTIQDRLEKDEISVDESATREHYMNWIKLWINRAVENVDSIKSEMDILEHMEKLRMGKVKPQPPKEVKPLKPILITREMLQNKVFGAGYRNLPTMSQEEYFEKELREGKIVQDYNSKSKGGASGSTAEEEKDEDRDEHDEEKLKKAREWDEWKDTHRRGEGNKERHG
eukprot:TCONS_00061925-protein